MDAPLPWLTICNPAYLLPISTYQLPLCYISVTLYRLPLCLQSVYVVPSASRCATDGSVCATAGSVCATAGSVCATDGSVCATDGSVCATDGSVCASCISCPSSEIFPLRLCTVQGHKFPCPRVTGLYLYRRYGPTWHQAVEDNDTDQSIDPASAVSLRAKVSCMVQSLVCKLLMWQAVALVPNIPNLHAVPPCVMYPWGSWSGCHIESSSGCLSKRTRRLVSHIYSNCKMCGV